VEPYAIYEEIWIDNSYMYPEWINEGHYEQEWLVSGYYEQKLITNAFYETQWIPNVHEVVLNIYQTQYGMAYIDNGTPESEYSQYVQQYYDAVTGQWQVGYELTYVRSQMG
ncbi:hypothetical protein, partial [Acinetobacter baumannii]